MTKNFFINLAMTINKISNKNEKNTEFEFC